MFDSVAGLGSINRAGTFADWAFFRAPQACTFEMTQVRSTGSVPASISSMIACRSVPFVEARTAILYFSGILIAG